MPLVTSHSRCSAISREPQISRPNAISASGGTVNSCSVKEFCAFCVVTCLGRIHSRLAEQLRFPVYSDDPTGEGARYERLPRILTATFNVMPHVNSSYRLTRMP